MGVSLSLHSSPYTAQCYELPQGTWQLVSMEIQGQACDVDLAQLGSIRLGT